MRWLTFLLMFALAGCDDSATTVAPPAAPALPVVVVDQQHVYQEKGRSVPYSLEATPTLILDATGFTFRDPENLARLPNSVHVIVDQSLFIATWPQTGTQSLRLDAQTLRMSKGTAFAGFGAGKQAFIAIGFDGPGKSDENKFTPFWIGTVLFR